MTVQELCKRINLEQSVEEKVLSFSETFDFASVQPLLDDFRDIHKQKEARLALQKHLGEDPGNLKILACMLKAAADLFLFYQEHGIDGEIYTDTMKCFSRFIRECYARTGKHHFDRQWWTARQAGGHLFRIGALEYEITERNQRQVISIHIPSDADFRKAACDASLEQANAFFRKHFPQYDGCDYLCHSWLLAPELKELLGPSSNILHFQTRFAITACGKADLEFLEWVYNTYEKDLDTLPERTQLQKSLKQYLLNGGMLSDAVGILIP